ncbi:ABC transporter permease [Natronolimnobius sp. AArcel1]|uniref:ABC transporter permease n=1 Tax=Natronolimnobius sp. AArcel1 TaxID=1679093 RepID=UPI0013E9E8AA|nr:ABC transporter permease [Natronolimnobius sp. AArcel1]NGM69140.1 ABC transporter permease [Natronolimnobius sp. AArcel1]
MAERTSTFQTDAEPDRDDRITRSRRELYRERLDLFVLTPLRVIWSDWRTRVGSLIILVWVFLGTVGYWLVSEPFPGDGPRMEPAFQSLEFPLGTTIRGESVFALVVQATPAMLVMITAGAVFSVAIATLVGTVSGYKGGRVDRALTVVTDIAMTIPGLPLIILLAALIEPTHPVTVGIVLTINAWAGLARAIRSQVLTLRDHSYVEASRIMGVPTRRIVVDDILPNIMPYVLVNFVQSARGVIFGSVALYYLGVLPFSNENWGVMLNDAYDSFGVFTSWETAHWILAPMFAVVTLSFGLILFAQGTERLFNPRIRARHAETIDEDNMEGHR